MTGILTDYRIRTAVNAGDIVIDPFRPEHVNPTSYDLTLGDGVTVYTNWVGYNTEGPPSGGRPRDGSDFFPLDTVLDVRREPETVSFRIDPERGWLLKPGIGYLMHTAERVSTKVYVPILDGKALALDTEIPTPDGLRLMGDLQEGDFVYGVDGHPTRILRVTPAMVNRPCYRLTFADGQTIVADEEHEWFVYPVDAKPRIYTTGQMHKRMDAQKRKTKRSLYRVRAAAVQGTEVLLPIAPYTLGAWLGDGTSSSANITVHDADTQILENIQRDGYTVEARARKLNCRTYVLGRKERVKNTCGQYITENGSLHAALRMTGVLNNKHIPETYLRASYQQRWALLQGLMDTDGTVHRDDQASITLTSKTLFEGVEELCRSLGLVTYRDERPAKLQGKVVGTAYRLTWRATPDLFRLDRKTRKVRQTDRWLEAARHPFRGIQTIEAVPSVPVRCITVEADDGLFLATRAFITTHNSSIGRLFLQVHATAGYGDPGFDGQFTLEVIVQHPIRVYPGMRICQIRFQDMNGWVERAYDKTGHYTGEAAQGAVPSQAWRQFAR